MRCVPGTALVGIVTTILGIVWPPVGVVEFPHINSPASAKLLLPLKSIHAPHEEGTEVVPG